MPPAMWSVTWQWNNRTPTVVRAHIDDFGARRKQLDRIRSRPLAQRRGAMPMRGMDICLVAEADQVPARPDAAAHGKAIEIAVGETIHRVLLVALFEFAVLFVDRLRRSREGAEPGRK
jgi:hypothetical protein